METTDVVLREKDFLDFHLDVIQKINIFQKEISHYIQRIDDAVSRNYSISLAKTAENFKANFYQQQNRISQIYKSLEGLQHSASKPNKDLENDSKTEFFMLKKSIQKQLSLFAIMQTVLLEQFYYFV